MPMASMVRPLVAALSLAALASGATGAASMAQTRDPGVSGPIVGHVTIVAKAADVGIGFTWGDGVLRYHGRTYHFTVKGVDVAAVGYSKVVAHGRVYNLKHLHDFDGTYGGANGEATVGQGLGGRILANGNGVQLRLDDVTKGARLAGAGEGMQLSLRDD